MAILKDKTRKRTRPSWESGGHRTLPLQANGGPHSLLMAAPPPYMMFLQPQQVGAPMMQQFGGMPLIPMQVAQPVPPPQSQAPTIESMATFVTCTPCGGSAVVNTPRGLEQCLNCKGQGVVNIPSNQTSISALAPIDPGFPASGPQSTSFPIKSGPSSPLDTLHPGEWEDVLLRLRTLPKNVVDQGVSVQEIANRGGLIDVAVVELLELSCLPADPTYVLYQNCYSLVLQTINKYFDWSRNIGEHPKLLVGQQHRPPSSTTLQQNGEMMGMGSNQSGFVMQPDGNIGNLPQIDQSNLPEVMGTSASGTQTNPEDAAHNTTSNFPTTMYSGGSVTGSSGKCPFHNTASGCAFGASCGMLHADDNGQNSETATLRKVTVTRTPPEMEAPKSSHAIKLKAAESVEIHCQQQLSRLSTVEESIELRLKEIADRMNSSKPVGGKNGTAPTKLESLEAMVPGSSTKPTHGLTKLEALEAMIPGSTKPTDGRNEKSMENASTKNVVEDTGKQSADVLSSGGPVLKRQAQPRMPQIKFNMPLASVCSNLMYLVESRGGKIALDKVKTDYFKAFHQDIPHGTTKLKKFIQVHFSKSLVITKHPLGPKGKSNLYIELREGCASKSLPYSNLFQFPNIFDQTASEQITDQPLATTNDRPIFRLAPNKTLQPSSSEQLKDKSSVLRKPLISWDTALEGMMGDPYVVVLLGGVVGLTDQQNRLLVEDCNAVWTSLHQIIHAPQTITLPRLFPKNMAEYIGQILKGPSQVRSVQGNLDMVMLMAFRNLADKRTALSLLTACNLALNPANTHLKVHVEVLQCKKLESEELQEDWVDELLSKYDKMRGVSAATAQDYNTSTNSSRDSTPSTERKTTSNEPCTSTPQENSLPSKVTTLPPSKSRESTKRSRWGPRLPLDDKRGAPNQMPENCSQQAVLRKEPAKKAKFDKNLGKMEALQGMYNAETSFSQDVTNSAKKKQIGVERSSVNVVNKSNSSAKQSSQKHASKLQNHEIWKNRRPPKQHANEKRTTTKGELTGDSGPQTQASSRRKREPGGKLVPTSSQSQQNNKVHNEGDIPSTVQEHTQKKKKSESQKSKPDASSLRGGAKQKRQALAKDAQNQAKSKVVELSKDMEGRALSSTSGATLLERSEDELRRAVLLSLGKRKSQGVTTSAKQPQDTKGKEKRTKPAADRVQRQEVPQNQMVSHTKTRTASQQNKKPTATSNLKGEAAKQGEPSLLDDDEEEYLLQELKTLVFDAGGFLQLTDLRREYKERFGSTKRGSMLGYSQIQPLVNTKWSPHFTLTSSDGGKYGMILRLKLSPGHSIEKVGAKSKVSNKPSKLSSSNSSLEIKPVKAKVSTVGGSEKASASEVKEQSFELPSKGVLAMDRRALTKELLARKLELLEAKKRHNELLQASKDKTARKGPQTAPKTVTDKEISSSEEVQSQPDSSKQGDSNLSESSSDGVSNSTCLLSQDAAQKLDTINESTLNLSSSKNGEVARSPTPVLQLGLAEAIEPSTDALTANRNEEMENRSMEDSNNCSQSLPSQTPSHESQPSASLLHANAKVFAMPTTLSIEDILGAQLTLVPSFGRNPPSPTLHSKPTPYKSKRVFSKRQNRKGSYAAMCSRQEISVRQWQHQARKVRTRASSSPLKLPNIAAMSQQLMIHNPYIHETEIPEHRPLSLSTTTNENEGRPMAPSPVTEVTSIPREEELEELKRRENKLRLSVEIQTLQKQVDLKLQAYDEHRRLVREAETAIQRMRDNVVFQQLKVAQLRTQQSELARHQVQLDRQRIHQLMRMTKQRAFCLQNTDAASTASCDEIQGNGPGGTVASIMEKSKHTDSEEIKDSSSKQINGTPMENNPLDEKDSSCPVDASQQEPSCRRIQFSASTLTCPNPASDSEIQKNATDSTNKLDSKDSLVSLEIESRAN